MNAISKKKEKAGPVKDKPKKKPASPAREGEEALPKQSFLKRLIFGEEKPDLSEIEAGSTTILDILSPTAVDTKSRDYIVVDGIFMPISISPATATPPPWAMAGCPLWWRPARASASTS